MDMKASVEAHLLWRKLIRPAPGCLAGLQTPPHPPHTQSMAKRQKQADTPEWSVTDRRVVSASTKSSQTTLHQDKLSGSPT